MASTDLIRDAVDAASDQRYPGTSAQPARFALVLNALDDPAARAQAIAGVLEPIGATIEPLSTLERGVLVATFSDRTFAGPNGAAFAAAHRFQEVFDLDVPFEMGWIAFLSKDSAQKIELHTASEGGSGSELPVISIGVDDLDAAEAAVRAAGAEVVYGPATEDWGLRRFFFRDPAGNLVNVVDS